MTVSRTPNMVDYEVERRTFHIDVPEYFNFAVDIIGKWAQDPQKIAVHWLGQHGEERQITFAEFAERSSRAANAFAALGLKKGDRVLVMLPRLPEWWESVLGLMKLGVIFIPCTTLLTSKDLQYRAEVAEAQGLITDREGAEKFDQVRGQCPTVKQAILVEGEARPGWISYHEIVAAASPDFKGPKTRSDDPCLVYFTSGTVGYPKMVLHTQASYPLGHTITGKYWLDLHEDDLLWNLSETGWAKWAWSNFFGPWVMGTAVFIQDARGKFNPLETLELLHRYPITVLCAPPTAYRMLVLEEPLAYLKTHPPRALRHCVGAGEPLNPEVIRQWQEATGMIIRDGYGQTETVLLCGNFPPLEVKPGSMGKPSPGFDVAVIDHEGNELPPGAEGDIAVRIKPERPRWLFQEYWRNPEATAACIRGDWYITGDRAYRDEDGYLWFVGRADDVIISAGYRIGPFEVESALKEHPAVAESAVVGSPDEVRGQIVKAFVVLAPGYSPSPELASELQEHVRRVTAPYKYPREIEFVETLPKTISGKIRRVELRELEHRRKLGHSGQSGA
ncbi:acyl-CoA synthetase [Thermogemmatispora aurantia]|jgi:acyl-coenzyme A synthetase/AMP-(fatty) acid ligase|uniref:Acyl-CoA synthetase n=1 Tax=Thermogemmatispora aurantia TaxID=2045279 RepID=A0A5J4KDC3_9CHLR|nr:AMP-binding protein [Thermogemmatispora aurantia]GER84972.1 acyl-CoA synthetase [Thermogemmatispora aurantia]